MLNCVGGLLLWASVVWHGSPFLLYQDWQPLMGASRCPVTLVVYSPASGYAILDDSTVSIPSEPMLYATGRSLYAVWVRASSGGIRQPWIAHWLASSGVWDSWALPAAGSHPWLVVESKRLLVKWIAPDGWIWVYDLGPSEVNFLPFVGR